jgi:hypothetical protein
LYVDEALQRARLEFQSVALGSDKVVRFIVGMFPLEHWIVLAVLDDIYGGSSMNLGKGLHTKDGKAKIRPAVEQLCKK